MIKFFLCYIVILLLSINAFSQHSVIKDSVTNKTKERYYTISLDILSVSLQYEKRINNKWYAGIEISGGMGYRLIIGKSIKVLDYQSAELSAGHISSIVETKKIKFFVSNYLTGHIYQSFGPYGSVVDTGDSGYPTIGVEYCFYYGFKKFKFGHRLQLGIMFLRFSGHKEANYNALYGSFTPIIFQIKF